MDIVCHAPPQEDLPDGLLGVLPYGQERFRPGACLIRRVRHEIDPKIETIGGRVIPALLEG